MLKEKRKRKKKKNPPSNAGGGGSTPGRGSKIPHAAGQLSLHALEPAHATTREPTCCNYWTHAPQLEKSTRRNEEPDTTKTRHNQINK